MTYTVGVDLGTTFTAVAVNVDGRPRAERFGDRHVIPSAVYRTPSGELLTGAAALAAPEDPTRLATGFKRRLGDPAPIIVGGAVYSPESLMAAQLRDILDTIAEEQGGPAAQVVLSYPAVWGPYRREQFLAVAQLAGVASSRITTEPTATAMHLAADKSEGFTEGDVVAVYDLGGGTLDVTVLRFGAAGMELLGSPEGIEHLGGLDFDQALLGLVDDRLAGRLRALEGGADDDTRLLDAARACTAAKEELSVREAVDIEVRLPDGTCTVHVTRAEFEDAIAPLVALSVDALHRVIASAGLDETDVDAIMLAGSSTRVPLVGDRIAALGRPVRFTLHPKLTVCLGASLLDLDLEPDDESDEAALPTAPIGLPVAATTAPSIAAGRTSRTRPPRRGRNRPGRRRRALLLSPPGAMLGAAILIASALTVTMSLEAASGPEAATLPTEQTLTAGQLVPPPEVVTPVDPDSLTGAETALVNEAAPDPTPEAPQAPRARSTMFDAEPAPGLGVFIQSGADGNENWQDTPFVGDSANRAQISVAQDGAGLRTTWKSVDPGQLYLLTASGTLDLAALANDSGALVFDVTVHGGQATQLHVGAHCGYPCGATVDLTSTISTAPIGQTTRIAIPASCLQRNGLDATAVTTPFVALGNGSLDVTFADIRWEAKSGADPTAVRC